MAARKRRRARRRREGARPRQLGLALPGWRVVDFDARSGNVTWTRPVWDGAAPIGEPGRSTRRGGAGRYIRPAIEAADPYSAWAMLEALPAGLQRPGASNFAFRAVCAARDGTRFAMTGPAFYNVESITRPQIFAQMLADVYIRAAHAHGYAGAVTVLAVELVMGADAAAVPARKGRRRPPPVMRRRLGEKLRSLDPRSVRFGRRYRRGGRYYQPVYDQHGRLRGTVRWYAGVRADLTGLLELGRELRAEESDEAEGWEE